MDRIQEQQSEAQISQIPQTLKNCFHFHFVPLAYERKSSPSDLNCVSILHAKLLVHHISLEPQFLVTRQENGAASELLLMFFCFDSCDSAAHSSPNLFVPEYFEQQFADK